ncbi:MAG: PorP/SprF family type IX secretion system membrane protein [Bacteroidota bacterium]
MSRKLLLLTATLLLCAAPSPGQIAFFNQTSNAQLLFNPGFAGSLDQFRIGSVYRADWTNLPGAPRKIYLAGDWMSHRLRGGIGFEALRISTGEGNYSQDGLAAMYSGKINLGPRWMLSLALKAGFTASNDIRSLTFPGRPALTDTREQLIHLTPGFLLNSGRFYVGISMPHALRFNLREVPIAETSRLLPVRRLNIQAGYQYEPYPDALWSLSVSGILSGAMYQSFGQLQMTYHRRWFLLGAGIYTFNETANELFGSFGVQRPRFRASFLYSRTLTNSTINFATSSVEAALLFYLPRKANHRPSSPEPSSSIY